MSSDRPQADAAVADTESAPEPADAVAAAVLEVPGVHELHGGLLNEVATYLPGRRVAGVRLRPDGDGGGTPRTSAEVHIVLDWDSPALATADAVRQRVESLVDGPVHVVVEDITGPAGSEPADHEPANHEPADPEPTDSAAADPDPALDQPAPHDPKDT